MAHCGAQVLKVAHRGKRCQILVQFNKNSETSRIINTKLSTQLDILRREYLLILHKLLNSVELSYLITKCVEKMYSKMHFYSRMR